MQIGWVFRFGKEIKNASSNNRKNKLLVVPCDHLFYKSCQIFSDFLPLEIN